METFSALLALRAGNSPVPVNSPHKGQWRGALMFSFIYAWINDWVNNREVGDLRRQDGHYDVIVTRSSSVKKNPYHTSDIYNSITGATAHVWRSRHNAHPAWALYWNKYHLYSYSEFQYEGYTVVRWPQLYDGYYFTGNMELFTLRWPLIIVNPGSIRT